MEQNLSAQWGIACNDLKEKLSSATYASYIASLSPVEIREGKLVLSAPNTRVIDMVSKPEYYSLIGESISSVFHRELLPQFELFSQPEAVAEPVAEVPRHSQLNPRFTFDNYIIGPNNELAAAAAKIAASQPGQERCNPLFLYGGTGLGKTHLMHAIGSYIYARNPQARIAYVTSERFTNDYITALQTNRVNEYRERYRGLDVLLIDDIQFIADKEGIQTEFFHTFNFLHDEFKQIVISADKHPTGIAQLQERLLSRFEGGLVVDILPPDYETRVAILVEKVKSERIIIDDPDVLPYIANTVTSNIRQLEGTLNKVMAYATLSGKSITLELAQSVLSNYAAKRRSITANDVQQAVCNYYSISLNDLVSRKKSRDIAVPRQIAMYLVRDMTELSFPSIGKLFNKHYSTVIHDCEKIAEECKTNTTLEKAMEDIRNGILEG